jgi:hypothetical protein
MRPNLAAALQKSGTKAQIRPIFVPVLVGGPTGQVLAKMNDRRLWIALFIQGWGHRNRVLCQECEKTLKGTKVTAPNPELPDKPDQDTYIMFPFHGCISIPGVEKNKCGNCIYKEKHCTMSDPAHSNAIGGRRMSGDGFPDITKGWQMVRANRVQKTGLLFKKLVEKQRKVLVGPDTRFQDGENQDVFA